MTPLVCPFFVAIHDEDDDNGLPCLNDFITAITKRLRHASFLNVWASPEIWEGGTARLPRLI